MELTKKRERLAFDRIKRQQKIKKVTLKQNNKVLEIEDILKREMEKRNRKICTKMARNK